MMQQNLSVAPRAVTAWLLQDLRHAVRMLRANRAFTMAAGGTLALALGASTLMFSVIDTVLLRPLPFRAPDELVMLWTGTEGRSELGRAPYVTVEAWQRHATSFADVAVLDPISATYAGQDGAEQVSVARVSPNLLSVLGIGPAQGRMFTREEGDARAALALVSHRFWQTRLGGTPDAIGMFIMIDGTPSRIVGILPEHSTMAVLTGADVWQPHTLFPDWETRRSAPLAASWFVVARVREAVTLERARAEMHALAPVIERELPVAAGRGVTVMPLREYIVGPRPTLALWLLTGAVICVLLVAGANVAALSVARGIGRAREMRLRIALGATPARIRRQLIVESLTLALLAGAVGTLIAMAGARVIRSGGFAAMPQLQSVSVDLRVLGWAFAVSTLAGVLVGFAPAFVTRRANLRAQTQDGMRGVSAGPAARRVRRALVIAELSIAVVLLISAGLLVRSWVSITRVELGFDPGPVLSLQLSTRNLPSSTDRVLLYDRVLEAVRAVPGVDRAGLMGDLFVGSDREQAVTPESAAGAAPERVRLRVDEASEEIFATLGTRLIDGRFFSEEDGPRAPPVAIVNEAMVRRLWPGGDAVSSRFKFGPPDAPGPWLTVVGVVENMRRQGPDIAPIPQVFVPLAQNPSNLETLLVRTTTTTPAEVASAVRSAVHAIDPDILVYGLTTLDERIGLSLAPRRLQTTVLLGFAGVALLMATVGVYGLVHYSVTARTQEIGTRVALGANARDIFGMIVREGIELTAIGLVCGLLGAVLAGRAASSLLFGVTGSDPLTFTIAPLVLTAAAAAACCIPAWRAIRIDPAVALRET